MGDNLYLIAGDESYQVFDLSNERIGLRVAGLGMPPVRHITQAAPLQDGVTLLASRFNERSIDVGFLQLAADRAAYWGARRGLIGSLSNFGTLVLRYVIEATGQSYDLDVVYAGGAELDSDNDAGLSGYVAAVRLVAHDPVWRASEPSSLVVGMPAYPDAGQLPFTFPIMFGASSIAQNIALDYAGTWRAYPEIDIRGPLTNPTIANLTTGEQLVLTAAIDTGDVVRFDLDPLVKTVWHQTDNVSWLPYLSSDSDLATWHLAPHPEAAGGTNALRLTGLSAGLATAITLRWHNRYVGV